MRTRRNFSEQENISYDLSISDLMSALCGIFALIMICVIIQLNTTKAEYNSKNKAAEQYYSMQYDLYLDLTEEFKDDLQRWNAEITKDLTIRFKDSNVLFEADKAELKPEFEEILRDFFPRLIEIINSDVYRDEVDEIRIEGHTSVDLRLTEEEDYETGMYLSQNRTKNVMIYCLGLLTTDRSWTQKHIAAIGYSNSRPVDDFDDFEKNREASRRVEFRIKTRAERVIEVLADEEFKKTHE